MNHNKEAWTVVEEESISPGSAKDLGFSSGFRAQRGGP